MSIFTHDDVQFFYTDVGTGPTVLLLHGWTCDSHDWSWQIPVLTELGFRVVAVDQRGHGRSSAPASDYGPQTLADDAAALLRHIGSEPALVIGHSMGTVVASALTVRHPELVSAIGLVDPVYYLTEEEVAEPLAAIRGPHPCEAATIFFRAAFYTPDTPESLITWHERRVLGTPPNVVREALVGLFGHKHSLGLSHVAREYLLDRNVPRFAVYASEETSRLERELPLGDHDEVHVIDDGGHFLHQHRADKFNELLATWLTRIGKLPGSAEQVATV
ncbi:alpha/beta fold hydrolase [Nocardia sp. 2YAB30]|uniref:alpha/beta fold hydrolase n=1 Tax=unclassified Nocardia TaxID=2637762 RepID=UPI003F9609DF